MSLAGLTVDELTENFSYLTDWEERYAYVIDLGKKLPEFPEELKTDVTIVRGCTSRVWFVLQSAEKEDIHFIADSDAHIVRGLIAILMVIYNDTSAEFIRNFAIEPYFKSLGLEEHLSPSRRNGFFAMVERIKSFGMTE
jgi:cysteine desulfuration protein SufE